MIYIFDNGESYSDHSIEFISTDGFDPKDAETILRRCRQFGDEPPRTDDDYCYYDNTFLVAKVDTVEWFAGRPMPLSELYHWRRTLKDPKEHFDQLKLETVKKLYDAWYAQIGIERNRINNLYENFPQPKRGRQLRESAHARLDEDKKLLTDHMDTYLKERGDQ